MTRAPETPERCNAVADMSADISKLGLRDRREAAVKRVHRVAPLAIAVIDAERTQNAASRGELLFVLEKF